MSKPQLWIVGAVVGVIAIVALVKHFGGSSSEDESSAQQRLAQEKTTQHGGWSVRSDSQDIATSDDVKVQRQVQAKPAGVAPRPPQPQQKPAGGSDDSAPAADSGAGNAQANNADANPGGAAAVANPGAPAKPIAPNDTSVPAAGGDTAANGGAVAANGPAPAQGGAVPGAPAGAHEAAGTGNTEHKPAQPQEQGAEPAPPEAVNPDAVAAAAVYDSKDSTFTIDHPVELKDIGNLPSHGVTMMMNLAPNWTPDNQDDADLLKLGDNLALTKNVNFLRLEYKDANGSQHSIGTDMTGPAWEDIEPPYSMAATVIDNQMALVVNGKLVAHGNWVGDPYQAPTDPTLGVGCVDYPASRPCAAGAATGVMVLPPMSNADTITRTKPPNAK